MLTQNSFMYKRFSSFVSHPLPKFSELKFNCILLCFFFVFFCFSLTNSCLFCSSAELTSQSHYKCQTDFSSTSSYLVLIQYDLKRLDVSSVSVMLVCTLSLAFTVCVEGWSLVLCRYWTKKTIFVIFLTIGERVFAT